MDCDDEDSSRWPGNVEMCDAAGHDDDCDIETLGDDADEDGFAAMECCNVGREGTQICGSDCDDADPGRHPGVRDACDQVDNDCDDEVDEDGCKARP